MSSKKILAVASAGGHWVQLRRMLKAFDGHQVYWMSTVPELNEQVAPDGFFAVRDANIWDKFGLIIMACQVAWRILKLRPSVVVTTGAAPGYFAIVFGSLLGAKTIWIDSLANADNLSLAGRQAARWADHWFTQWPELARENGPFYIGSVL